MRYFVNLDPAPDASPIVVDLTELPTGALDVSVGGKRVAVDVVSLAGGALSVRVDGQMVDLTTEGQPPELGAIASGHRSYVRVESERQRAAAAAKKGGTAASDKLVKSPMPGRVIRLLVAAKDEVAPGQTLCVIEAMKMENEVKAKSASTVAEVHVTEGATVEANGKLFTLA
ncbi:MAG: acetyl-CoA carboxylase biotin carboxyl carrier protein subunit [Polyangiales bacterium]